MGNPKDHNLLRKHVVVARSIDPLSKCMTHLVETHHREMPRIEGSKKNMVEGPT
jgi:coenzyme F420-reducing hydrogenase alpha subunit